MKLITLAENTALSPELTAEHGLSLWVEAAGNCFLFDAGQTDAFARNAEILEVDLGRAAFAILSHGHYDHSGGMARFRAQNPRVPIYVRPEAFLPCFNPRGRDIRMPQPFQDPAWVERTLAIGPGLTLHSCADCGWDYDSAGFTIGSPARPDRFDQELYLLAEEKGRRILFSGCSHRGIRNLMDHFRPDVFVGGLHLNKLDPQGKAFSALAQGLADSGAEFYIGHCTGEAQYRKLAEFLGPRIHRLSAGACFEL